MKKTTICILFFLVCCMAGCNRDNNSAKENDLFSSATKESNVITEENVVGKKVGAETKATVILPEYNDFNRLQCAYERESFFCIASDTGILYFVNRCQDRFIYCLRDGVAELAVPLPAKELYYRQGMLYFVVDNYEKYTLEGIKNGDIFAYNPAEGTVELVYSLGWRYNEWTQMLVDEDGIYVSCFVEDGEYVVVDGEKLKTYETLYYMLDFDNPELVLDGEERAKTSYGDCTLSYYYHKEENLLTQTLISKTYGTKDMKMIDDDRIIDCCLVEDKLYYTKGLQLIVVDMDTFEKEVYDCNNYYMETYLRTDEDVKKGFYYFNCFTVTEDYFWCTTNGPDLFRIDRESKEIESYQLMDEDGELLVARLYTDGKNVYALYSPNIGVDGEEEMVRLLVDETDEWYEFGPVRVPVVRVKKLIP